MRKLLASLLLSTIATSLFAWDGNGHALVAVIAHKRLAAMAAHHDSRAARALHRMDDLLAHCPSGYHDAGVAASYPDDVKSGIPALGIHATTAYSTMHYNNVEVSDWGNPWHPLSDEAGVVKGIALCESVLTGHPAAQVPWGTDPSVNLMFYLHFVGDIHQPLHIAEAHDEGGNNTFLDFGEGHARRQKLHSYWDDVATRAFSGRTTDASVRLKPNPGVSVKSDPAHVSALADILDQGANHPAPHDAQMITVDDWAQDAYHVGHDVAYAGIDLGFGTIYTYTDHGRERTGMVYPAPTDYDKRCRAEAIKRIVLGGYHLANRLRQILGA